MADWVPITDPNDPRLANTPVNVPPQPSSENPWDQFEAVGTGTATATAPATEDFSQFDAHKGPATHKDLVFQSLKDYGATPTATAAILGDIQQESDFNPHLSDPNDRSGAHGLLQVGTPMFRQFNEDQARKGIAPGSQDYVYNQAPFIMDRFKRQHPDRWEAMQNAGTSTDALRIFRGTKDWGYGIAGKRYQYAQSYEEALKGVPVEQVDKEIRVEKAIPVNVREMQVARARPVNGQTPPAAEPTPAPATEDWSQFAEVKLPTEEEAAAAPRAVATQPWYERAYAALQQGDYGKALQTFDIAAQQGVRRTLNLPIRGPVTEQDLHEAMAPSKTPMVGGFLPREERTSAEMAQTTKIPPRLVNPIIQKAGYNLLVDTVNFVNTPEGAAIAAATGVAGAVEPAIARFTTLGFAADSARSAITAAMEGRWADSLESLGMTGLLGHGARQAAKAEFPVARPVPRVVERAAPEAVPEAAPPPAEAPAAAPEAPPAAPPEAAPVEAAAPEVAPPPAEAPAAPPEAAAPGEAAAPEAVPAPAEAAPTAEAPAPVEAEAPAPVEDFSQFEEVAGAPEAVPEAAAPPAFPPPAPGEQPGSAWHGVPFLSQEPIKAKLVSMGYEPDAIEAMTRSQLNAATPLIEAAPQQAPEAAPAAPTPAAPEAPAAPAVGQLIKFKMPAVVKGERGTTTVAGTVLRTLPDGKLEVRLQQGGYHQIDPAEIISQATAPKGRPAKPLTKAQQAEAEHRAELEAAGKQAIQAQGGMDLIEAVQHEGGLPLKGTEAAHHYRGELKMLRETIQGTKGTRYRDVFRAGSPGIDHLVLRLRARGFNVETPHELIDRIQERIRSGRPHYALPEAGQFFRPAEEPELKLGAPESVEEQKARMAREKAEAKARAVEAEKKAKVKYGWQQKLTGTAGNLGQQELGGVIPGPEAPELFRPGAQPQTLPRQITPTPAGVTEPAAGVPIAEADIRNYLSRALDIPVRAGMNVAGGMKRALGVYRVKQETIRTRLRNDIPTIAHEVGHYVHHLLFTDPNGKPSEFATTFDNELMSLGQRTSLPSYTPERVRMEGVAEFAREWLTDRAQALAKAPDFTPFFEGELQNKFPQTWEIFEKARNDIAKFIAQPGWQKAQSRIVFDPKQPRTQFRDWLSRKYTEWFNELAPIDRTMKKLTTFGLDPATAQRVSERAINYKGGWRGKADFDLEFDQTNINGNKVGPGLKAVLNGLDPKELSDFSTYLALKRAAEKKAQGIRTGFEQDLADPEVRKHMADLAPRYEAKRQAIIKYSDNALQLLADSGFFSGDQMARIRKANQDYVPFYRIYEDAKPAGPRGTTKSGGFVNTSSGVLRMKGSDRQIIDPLESIVKNTYAFRDLAERNRIGREFVDAVEKTQGGGRIGESVMKPVKPSRVSHEELTAHLEKLGLDEEDINNLGDDIGMTLWRATNGIKPSEGVFRVWDKGKERLFQVDDPDLLKSLSLADSADAAAIKMLPLFKPFQAMTRMLRTGATLTPEFMARNPFRDQVTGAVFSRYGFVPFFDGFKGMLSVLGKDDYYKDWVKAGGRYSGLYDIEGPTMRKTMERVIRDPNALEQAWSAVRHPLQTLGAASGAFEHATRVGEFRKAIDAGVDPMIAANASKDVTLNFSRAGIKGKLANQVLAFFNAGLQDVDKFARAHRDAPVRTATKAFMYITVPSIVAWTLGKNDPQIQNLPEWRKDFFWNLNIKGTVISLPKPFLLGALYGTSVEKALDYASGRDPNAVRKALSAIYQVGSPARGDMIAATNAFKPLLENMTNYSFFQQKPLVSQSQQQLSKGLQFAPNTSETAKFVGKKLNQSPIMIDNLIRGYFGGLGRYGTDITDWAMLKAQAADSPAPPAKAISQYPLVRGFVKQPYEQSAYVQRFYAGLDRAETRLNDMRTYGQRIDSPGMRDFLKENRDALVWYNAGRGDGTLMTELRKTRDNLSDINKAMVAVQQSRGINPEEKAKRLLKLGELRDKLAEATFKTYIHPSDREKVF